MKCNIVKDLLPLYFDGLCSEETCRQMEEHMEQCGECRQLKQSLEPEREWSDGHAEYKKNIQPFRKIRNKLRRKNALIIVCIILILLLSGMTSLLTYGQITKTGWSFETVYEALRFRSIGRQFAAGNTEPLFETLSGGYMIRDAESNAVRMAYPNRESYDEDMKAVLQKKYREFFDGKDLRYRGIEEIGYSESARTAWDRTLYICLKFTGEEQTEYYISLYKMLNGKFLADDFFGTPYLLFTEGGTTGTAGGEGAAAVPPEASLFSALPDGQTEYTLNVTREVVLESGRRALQGDTKLAENGQMRLNLVSEQDRATGTREMREDINEKISGLAEYGYYMTDFVFHVEEYDRSEHLYKYRMCLEFADGHHGEVLLSFDCYRTSEMFVYLSGTDRIYIPKATGEKVPAEVIQILEGLFGEG